MINQEVAAMLVEQINKELHSGYLYLEFANYYEDRKLPGFAQWFVAQAGEENGHAYKIRRFLIDAGQKVALAAIAEPQHSFTGPREPLEAALKHEQYITASINTILEKAIQTRDFLTAEFLQWFVKEQGEEEMNAQQNLDKFDMVGEAGPGLFLLDMEFGKRGGK